MIKINLKLLPIKAHYFLFMAAMGPILPQISVYGKQLGVSPEIMGYVTSILPLLYVLAKPGIGLLADYFTKLRKLIFLLVIIIMTLSYAGFYFVPQPIAHTIDLKTEWNVSGSFLQWDSSECQTITKESLCTDTRKVICNSMSTTLIQTFDAYITLLPNRTLLNSANFDNANYNVCLEKDSTKINIDYNLDFTCHNLNVDKLPDCLYDTVTFWLFVILLCIGTIGFNVTNCISDAICFDVLGPEKEMKYGKQRVWGTIGFGVTALVSGIVVYLLTIDAVQSFTPALIIMLIFSGLDILSVKTLKLPKFSSSDTLLKDIGNLLCQPSIVIFLCFATLAGIIDSFIIYFMFWHLEDVAAATGYMSQIKLIEGCVVAAECLCGEIPMFLYSGKIIKKLGYVHCLTLCFFTYSIRLALISIIPNPWYLVPIEMIMQGCTYALCYTCIVAYASAVAPPGTSATIQGLVAGMDDGLGFAIGSLLGGQAMKYWGGRLSFQIFAAVAFVTCIGHIILRPAAKHEIKMIKQNDYVIPTEQDKLDKLEL